jgi:uncharacterized protein (TIRG00374 family)
MSLRRRLGWWAVKAVVTGGLLYAVFTVVPLAQVMRALASADGPTVAASVVLLIVSRTLAAWRTKLLARQQGLVLSTWQAFEINAASMFYGLFLPGTLGGGAVRWYKLARKGGRPSQVITVILLDRTIDTIGLAAVGLACWLFGTRTPHHPLVGAALLAVLMVLGACCLPATGQRLCGLVLAGLARRNGSWLPARLRGMLGDLAVSAERSRAIAGRPFAAMVGLSAASHFVGLASFWVLFLTLGLRVGFLDAGWVRSAVTLLAMLPITVAGLGVREGGHVLLLVPLGVSSGQAVAVSWLRFLTGLCAALLGGVLELKNLWQAGRRAADQAPILGTPARGGQDRIAVVVLNYNKRQELLACLESVRRLAVAPRDVIVVDNGSTDGSVEAVAEAFPEVRLVRHASNLGIPQGRNAGWREASRLGPLDGVLFLDNDTVVTPDSLTYLIGALRRDPRAGIVCGKGYTRFPSRTIMSAGMTVNRYTGVVGDRGTGLVDDGRYDRPGYVDACGGFAYLVRHEVLAALGGLDERFSPYGWEDVDFCLRAKARGFLCRYVPEAVVFHSGGKIGRQPVFRYERLKVRNYLLLLQRHTTWWQRLSCCVCVPVRACGLLVRLAAQGHAALFAAHWQGLREGIHLVSQVNADHIQKP